MSRAQIIGLFRAGQTVQVTNHYITRQDHPWFGTTERTIKRVSSSHLHFETSNVPWPKAAQLTCEGSTVRFYGGGAAQQPADLFLTIEVR